MKTLQHTHLETEKIIFLSLTQIEFRLAACRLLVLHYDVKCQITGRQRTIVMWVEPGELLIMV